MAAGTMIALSVTTGIASGIDTTDQLEMFEAYQKVFIVNGSNLRVADFINTRIATTDIVTAASNTFPEKGTILTGGTSSAVMVCDYITAVDGSAYIYGYNTTGTFSSVDAVTGTNTAASAPVSFTSSQIPVSAPNIYDWTPYPDSASGSMPDVAYLGCMYRGRCVLSGNPTYPHQWYMSRQADPWDWAYLATDSQSPVAGGNSDAGEVGDVVRCLIPVGDDYLIMGCASQVWLMRGDPAAGGSLDQLSRVTGMFGPRSWCWDSQRNLYFWGSQGIYKMSPDFSTITNITQQVLPDLIKDESADPSTHRITFGFDHIREGIMIAITVLSSGENSCYWYDIRTGGLFPETYPTQCGPYSQLYHTANATSLADLLVGCKDGYLRVFNDDSKDDDIGATDQAIESKLLIGPAMIGQDADSRGRLKTLTIVTGRDTDSATGEVYVKDTAEEIVDSYALDSTPHQSITLSLGRSQRFRPRSRGSYLGVVIENTTSTETWSLEKIAADIKPAGNI